MPITFKSSVLQDYYSNGSATDTTDATASELNGFRNGGAQDIQNDIASLDSRIQSFEQVLIPASGSASTDPNFPYDRDALRREFLDEVFALLIRRGANVYVDSSHYRLTGTITNPPDNNFTESAASFDSVSDDVRLSTYLTDAGDKIYKHYQKLITDVFAEGDKLKNDPTDPSTGTTAKTSVLSSISPVTIDGVVYSKIGVVNGVTSLFTDVATTTRTEKTQVLNTAGQVVDVQIGFAGTPVAQTSYLPLYANGAAVTETIGPTTYTQKFTITVGSAQQTFQLTSDRNKVRIATGTNTFTEITTTAIASESRGGVTVDRKFTYGGKDYYTDGFHIVSGSPATTTDGSSVTETAAATTYAQKFNFTNDSTQQLFFLTANRNTVRIANGTNSFIEFPTTVVSPAESRNNLIVDRKFTYGGKDYYISTDGANIAIGVPSVQTASSLRAMSATDFLYYWNEARVHVLRSQLAYKEAVVREIQDDLRQANEALADLENQAGRTRANNKDGDTNPDSSNETFKMDMFEGMVSLAGSPLFSAAGPDDKHNYSEWGENRVSLKNYIDRKSAQAQEATLDYQQVLNRFNNAYEVMAKLQEKLDGLLKSQLRNVL